MQFEYQDKSLWYGTPDAPAPEESVQAGAEIAVTIGVSPVDASNNVALLYRIDHGPTEIVPAKWVQNDPSGKAQYFRAVFPPFVPAIQWSISLSVVALGIRCHLRTK